MIILAECQPGTYGLNCNQVCQCSEANHLCHPVTGACYCAPGYHGDKCDIGKILLLFTFYPRKSEICTMHMYVSFAIFCAWLFVTDCKDGRYGPNCEHECLCLNGGVCQPIMGTCDCPPGYIGANCNISE